jgi:hypothetical protein
LSFISVFVPREPEEQTSLSRWGYPWTTGALIGSVSFLVGAIASDTRNSLYALLLLAVSYPVVSVIKLLTLSPKVFRGERLAARKADPHQLWGQAAPINGLGYYGGAMVSTLGLAGVWAQIELIFGNCRVSAH